MDEAPTLPLAGAEARPEEETARETAAPAAALVKHYCPDWLINLGWLNTALALSISNLPLQFLLKNGLRLDAEALARFMLIAHIPIYIKPLAGILSDALPLGGTRRRHYLVLSLVLGGLFWLLMGLVPRSFNVLLWTFFGLNIFLTLTSTVLGGLMVEVGKHENKTGRLSAQRHGISQFVGVVSGPAGGFLAKQPFFLTSWLCALIYAVTAPAFWLLLREPRNQKADRGALRELGSQARILFRSRTLWSAAGLVVLVIAAPGFGTPLFYYQTDVLKFDPEFLGRLGVITAVCGMLAAYLYTRFCRRRNLRFLLGASIVFHAVMTLLYLFYRSRETAMVITGLEAMTMVWALLPLYDLAARATPKGSEALGYSLMMSVWNFTHQLSNLAGSWLYSHWGLTFNELVWVNAGTTLLVLIAVPFLPSVLMDRRDGDPGEPA